MNRPLAAMLGFLNLLPLAYIIYFFAHVAAMKPGVRPEPMLFESVFSLHLTSMVLTLVLAIIYLVVAYRSPNVPNDKRTFWAFVLLFGTIFTFPIFWYLFVWRTNLLNERAL
jgi:hypothetical protein